MLRLSAFTSFRLNQGWENHKHPKKKTNRGQGERSHQNVIKMYIALLLFGTPKMYTETQIAITKLRSPYNSYRVPAKCRERLETKETLKSLPKIDSLTCNDQIQKSPVMVACW